MTRTERLPGRHEVGTQSAPDREQSATPLSLREASELLGIHPATLRSWADQGKVPVTRTAGGHRRFALEDIKALTGSSQQTAFRQNVETLIHSALGRTRMQVSEGKLIAERIYAHYGEEAREEHRQLGQRLLRLIMRALTDEGIQEAQLNKDLQALGKLYASLGKRNGLTLREAVQVFLVFRDMLLESTLQMAAGQQFPVASDTIDLYRRVNGLVDRILLAMVDAYEQ